MKFIRCRVRRRVGVSNARRNIDFVDGLVCVVVFWSRGMDGLVCGGVLEQGYGRACVWWCPGAGVWTSLCVWWCSGARVWTGLCVVAPWNKGDYWCSLCTCRRAMQRDTDCLLLPLCLPKGLQLRTQKQSLEAVYHPFLITREDGSRSYGFAYTFYEEVNRTRICTALHSLQSAYLAEVSSAQGDAGSDSGGTPQKGDARRDTRSLPREFRWSSPKSGAARLFYDVTKDQLFVSKCIVLVGRQPEVAVARKFLVGLYKLFTECEGGAVTLESHVHNLLHEVHVPPPGRCLAFSCVGAPQLCYRPTSHELPLLLYPLRELFSVLSPECVIQLLSCMLLENQVLLVSADYYRLMLVAECMCALVLPFTWHHVYVPILPAALSHFLDAPVPFIMGLHATPAAKSHIAIPDEANLCLVDVDAGAVDVPEDLPQFPHAAEFVSELSALLRRWELPAAQHHLSLDRSCANESFIHKHRRRRKYSWSHDSDSGVSSNEGSISGSMCGSMSDSVTGSMSGSFSGSMSSSMTGSLSDSHSSAGSWHQHNGPSSLKTLRCDKIQINAGGSSRLRDHRPPPLSLYNGGQSPSLDRPQPSKTGSIFSNKLIGSKDKCELTSSVDSSKGTKVIPKADILSTDNMGNRERCQTNGDYSNECSKSFSHCNGKAPSSNERQLESNHAVHEKSSASFCLPSETSVAKPYPCSQFSSSPAHPSSVLNSSHHSSSLLYTSCLHSSEGSHSDRDTSNDLSRSLTHPSHSSPTHPHPAVQPFVGGQSRSGSPRRCSSPGGVCPSSSSSHTFLRDISQSPNSKDFSLSDKKAGLYDRESLWRALVSTGLGGQENHKHINILDITPSCPEVQAFLEVLLFNSALREVFFNRFVQMFCTYDHFVIQPDVREVDMETWLTNRESLQNFDKATFLSDQPVAHLPFLSRFIESQMFASFIDHKILSFWGEVDNNQRLFDARIRQLRENVDESAVRPPSYEPCTNIADSAAILEKRLSRIDYIAPAPVTLDPLAQSCTLFNPGHFPLLDRAALNKEPQKSKKGRGAWRRRERQAQHLQHTGLSAEQKDKVLSEAKTLHPAIAPHPKLADMAPALMAHTNWKFVEQLLKECKTRTKRMLVAKMGAEAVELGHQEASLVGVEENTLVASLCHLLERVWAHGLQTKQGKSALWSHLLSYREVELSYSTTLHDDPNYLSPGQC
ncbi:DENN domain [Trinorchestia longiramus]|nr:DENN domain [Trinorchestia longiramus]